MTMSDSQMSLRDFKQWLAGVEEMQGAEWVPSMEQWKKIREKIDSITEVEVKHTIPQVSYPAPAPPMPYTPAPQYPQSSGLDIPQGPIHRPMMPAVQLPTTMVMSTDGTGKAVTPNIDTSNGQYNSAFT